MAIESEGKMLIIKVHNDTGTGKIDDYSYGVFVNEWIIASGVVKGHDRSRGWRDLLQMIVDKEARGEK